MKNKSNQSDNHLWESNLQPFGYQPRSITIALHHLQLDASVFMLDIQSFMKIVF